MLTTDGIQGEALKIVAEFDPDSAQEVGLKVHVGDGEKTVIGYDATRRAVVVHRRASGETAFPPTFTGQCAGPPMAIEGPDRLHICVDWSSVEVSAGDSSVVFTEQVFPSPDSDGVALYAQGGDARLVSLQVWKLASMWRAAE